MFVTDIEIELTRPIRRKIMASVIYFVILSIVYLTMLDLGRILGAWMKPGDLTPPS